MMNKSPFKKLKTATALCCLAFTAGGAMAQSEKNNSGSDIETWWNGKGLVQGSGNPIFDARQSLEDRGFKMSGKYGGAFYGILDSQNGSHGVWDQEIVFGADLNFGKLLGVEALEGMKAFSNFRWRDPSPYSNPNEYVEAQSMFNPSHFQSGTQFRVLGFGLEYSTKELLPVKDMVVARGGWMRPQQEFVQQPLSKLFLNNAIESAKGLGGNIPFSSSYSAWGGTLEIKPHELVYIKNGLFMSFPEATSSFNHGLAFQGYAQDTDLNGLLYMGEAGFTPKIGESKLEGKYAFGGYFYGTPENQTRTWSNNYVDGRYGFYFQADQMLYREPSAPVASSAPSDGKSFKEVAPAEKPKLSKQGLNTFNLITMAPGYARSNNFPFYFQTGLVYTGLIPGRDQDSTQIAFGYGAYQGDVNTPPKTYTAVLEAAYSVQLNGWAFIRPFFQYLINPQGDGEVVNSAILGFSTGLTF
jgi:carbohydrate-selective porin OprB